MKNLFVLFFLISISVCFSQQKEFDKNNSRQIPAPENETITDDELIMSYKNPALSFACSLVLPSLGQMYNEEVGLGFGLLTGSALSFILFNAGMNSDDEAYTVIFGIIFTSIELFAIIDAPLTSANINKYNRIKRAKLIRKYGHALEFHSYKETVGIDLGSPNSPIGLTFSYHF